jgi:hypothetical protein
LVFEVLSTSRRGSRPPFRVSPHDAPSPGTSPDGSCGMAPSSNPP